MQIAMSKDGLGSRRAESLDLVEQSLNLWIAVPQAAMMQPAKRLTGHRHADAQIPSFVGVDGQRATGQRLLFRRVQNSQESTQR